MNKVMISTADTGWELVGCPECGDPAEIIDRWTQRSTGGHLEHVKVQCVNRHWFLMAADRLPAPAGTEPAPQPELTHRDGEILRAVDDDPPSCAAGWSPTCFSPRRIRFGRFGLTPKVE